MLSPRALLAPGSMRLSALVAATCGVALCMNPLLGVHGPESALVLGLLLPPFCAAVGAGHVLATRELALGAQQRLLGAALRALLVLGVPVGLLGLNALRVPNCAPFEGLLFMALGPAPSVVLAAVLGGMLALAWPTRPRTVVWLAVLCPVAAIVVGLARFYGTPGVFAYGHFYGYFQGSLYDEQVELPAALWSLRALTLVWLAAISAGAYGHFRPDRGRLHWVPQRPLGSLLCLLLAGVLVAGYARGPQLGHRSSLDHIKASLGHEVTTPRCQLLVPQELHRDDVGRLSADCEFRASQMEHALGLRLTRPLRVFLFRSAAEKRRLMGAAGTNIAKPWRHEVYLQQSGWPHGVLAHEIAHVVAGETGVGPFRIAGSALGLWPNPGLIEGTAVAAAWDARSGLTPHQWARAMLELGIAPKLQAVFGASFLGQQPRLAYTVAGSVLRYVMQRYGRAAVRSSYRTGDLAKVLGKDFAALEREWTAFLRREVRLDPDAAGLAAQRFAGTSVFSKVCPHQVARLRASLGGALAAGDDQRARQHCRAILEIDPAHNSTRATLVGVLARLRQMPQARSELQTLRDSLGAPAATVAGARLELADQAFRRGAHAAALQAYGRLLAEPQGRGARRALLVRQLALTGGGRQRQLLFELMVGRQGRSPGGAFAVHIARELRSERSDGLPHYLEARQLHFAERFEEAAALLAQARSRGLPHRELSLEARRMEAVSRFAAGDLERSAQLWRAQALEEDPAMALEADDWLARIRFSRKHAARAQGPR